MQKHFLCEQCLYFLPHFQNVFNSQVGFNKQLKRANASLHLTGPNIPPDSQFGGGSDRGMGMSFIGFCTIRGGGSCIECFVFFLAHSACLGDIAAGWEC